MPTYVTLYKLTDQGMKDIKNAPARIEAGIKAGEKMGAKNIQFYVMMGDWDYIAIGEFPSDEAAATFLLALGSLGNVKTTTYRVFTVPEFTDMVKKLP